MRHHLDCLTVKFAISIMYVILYVRYAEVLNFGFLSSTLFGYGFYCVILHSVKRLL
jgi:hypothetical protein